jgi:hypothetical protein
MQDRIEISKEQTDEWKNRGFEEGQQFATLTDIITKAWLGKTTKEYKVTNTQSFYLLS